MTIASPAYDPRVTPARPDIGASALRGRVDAQRFVDGTRHVVVADTLDLKRSPRPDAPLDTQLLHGEAVTVFDDEDGWGWVQAERDGYVGYVAMNGLKCGTLSATHRVIVNRTFVYPAADMKTPVLAALPLGAIVVVEDQRGSFVKTWQGYVVSNHVVPSEILAPDPVAVAEQLMGAPYLWGGKTPQGIDCSGLVQLSRAMAGLAMPRDADMQERLGQSVPVDADLGGLTRGDLVFWRGHVGMMIDATNLIHANAHHMLVVREPLMVARDRIVATSGTPISSIRRLRDPAKTCGDQLIF